jgi:O-acetyl-ADP-ribose deacetylase (regulator of RNase III)
MKAKINKITLRLIQGELWALNVEALVHSTNPNLVVAPRLAALAGNAVEQECLLIGFCDVGAAVLTTAGNLPAKKIIHAVGPRWGEGSERGKLANVTWETLRLAEEHGFRSIAIPPISIGSLGGYPIENCAKVMVQQIIDFTFEPLKTLREIIICVESDAERTAFHAELQRQLATLSDAGDSGHVPAL